MQRGRKQTSGGGQRGRGSRGGAGCHRQRKDPEEAAKTKKDKNMQFMQSYTAAQRYSAPAALVEKRIVAQDRNVYSGNGAINKNITRLPKMTVQDVTIPAMHDPPLCGCWENPGAAGPWTDAGNWSSELFIGVTGTAAMNGAKVAMCSKMQSEMGPNEHRVMHISLNNGEIRIDVPILESVEGVDTPYYTQHWYCTTHRRFERKALQQQKPLSPILWTSCAVDPDI